MVFHALLTLAPGVGVALAVLIARRREPKASQKKAAARIAAIDSGHTRRIVSFVRATYGDYPRKFFGYFVELAPSGLILRPGLLLRFRYPTVTVTEPILSAHVRPFADEAEHRHLSSGRYDAGGAMEMLGRVVVTCQTPLGVLEFAPTRRNVPVLLHYLQLQAPSGGNRALAFE